MMPSFELYDEEMICRYEMRDERWEVRDGRGEDVDGCV
jgi:hypothetical protein